MHILLTKGEGEGGVDIICEQPFIHCCDSTTFLNYFPALKSTNHFSSSAQNSFDWSPGVLAPGGGLHGRYHWDDHQVKSIHTILTSFFHDTWYWNHAGIYWHFTNNPSIKEIIIRPSKCPLFYTGMILGWNFLPNKMRDFLRIPNFWLIEFTTKHRKFSWKV